MPGGCIDANDKPLEWAVGFFFGDLELSLELWKVIAGISGFGGRVGTVVLLKAKESTL